VRRAPNGRAWGRAGLRPSARADVVLAAIGGVTFAVSALLVRVGATRWDTRLFLAMNDVSSGVATVLTPISRLFLPSGLAVVIVVAAAYVTVRNRSLVPLLVGLSAGTLAWVLASVAKAAADRPRPYEVLADAVLRQQPAMGTSFPSSHTAVAVAVVVALLPFVPRPLGAAAIVYAVLVGWSRVYLGVHYPLDVLGGAGIGLAVGGLVILAFGRMAGTSGTDAWARDETAQEPGRGETSPPAS
jgi:undecaprenyl-diphosphatase